MKLRLIIRDFVPLHNSIRSAYIETVFSRWSRVCFYNRQKYVLTGELALEEAVELS
jgi:hypothetical protein